MRRHEKAMYEEERRRETKGEEGKERENVAG